MPQKLKQFLASEKIKASQFATAIGYGDGAVSHILSGRNKPAWEMICKILAAYPQLNPDWLLRGEGPMYRPGMGPGQVTDQPMPIPDLSAIDSKDKEEEPSSSEPTVSRATPPTPSPRPSNAPTISLASSEKPIKRIVVLYADNTFESYTPNE